MDPDSIIVLAMFAWQQSLKCHTPVFFQKRFNFLLDQLLGFGYSPFLLVFLPLS